MTDALTDAPGPTGPAPRSPVLLVAYGIAAGVFVLYVIGWIVAIPRATSTAIPGSFGEIMTAAGAGVAIASGPLWFGCAVLLTRKSATWVKIVWLAVGVVLLAPLPLLIGAAR
jgi:hypothetical protein